MTIAFGRRRLILSLVVVPSHAKSFEVPLAENATDRELARLNGAMRAAEDRVRWEVNAILYGGPWVR
ncbi:MAG TPA: hypothetical protein VH482_24550 [Thermomicrobiales bacterium]|jgi:hypothetical protein